MSLGCTTRRRAAQYLAQAGCESGCFNWLEEFGGPDAWYAPCCGRGAIMLTHRENYQAIGDLMGVNIADDPGQIRLQGQQPRGMARGYRTVHGCRARVL